MQSGQPSRTAWAAAFHRAAHQVLEQGWIFSDPLALRILGKDAETVAREIEESREGDQRPSRRRMRIFIAARHRFAEDALAAWLDRRVDQDVVDQGRRQVVVLGAGLDTWAYRNPCRDLSSSPWGDRLHLFEVDHPATQAWKRQLLADAAIPVPSSLTFAPVDFEKDTLADGLAAAGFDREQPTFFTWLGVVPYLTEEAVWSTLDFIASVGQAILSPADPEKQARAGIGTEVVFDYGDPPDSLSPEMRAFAERRAAHVAEWGERFLSYFEPEKLHAKLRALGFREIEDLGPPQIASRYFPSRAASMPEKGGHILRAFRRLPFDGSCQQ
jgi:methyltransferase (TIGR00027 family)